MKSEIVLKTEFEPVKLTITIESEDELRDLYLRFNFSEEEMENHARSEWVGPPSPSYGDESRVVWEDLKRMCKKRGIHKGY